MNFTKLSKLYIQNYTKLKNPDLFRKYIQYEHYLIQWKRNKLRLGKIIFEYEDVRYGNTVLASTFKMVFANQSNTDQAQKQFNDTYNFVTWKWDTKNVLAAALILLCLLAGFISFLKHLSKHYLSAFYSSTGEFEALLKYSLDITLNVSMGSATTVQYLTQLLSENVADFCIHFNFIV